MREFRLPDVGEGISEGELVEWRVSVGDVIAEGDVVAEVATDKVTVELPSPARGRVSKLHVSEGDIVPVGEIILSLADGDGDTSPDGGEGLEDRDEAAGTPSAPTSASAALDASSAGGGGAEAVGSSSGSGRDELAVALGRVIAAPSTRRFAAEHGVDLTAVRGSGPGGRILRSDVEAKLQPPVDAHAETEATTSSARADRRVPVRGVRAASFDHMAESARTTATSTTTFEVHADRLLDAVKVLRAEGERRGTHVSPIHVVASCVATALARHERLNATFDEGRREVTFHATVNLGVAVATDAGLVVPVVRDVANRRVIDIATEIGRLAQRAREGQLTLDELRSGTFTLSSTGGLEQANIISTNPVINLPQVATLWTSRIAERPRVRDGVLEAGPVMVCSLSFDHRLVDGAEATAFINDLANLLEFPTRGMA